MDAFLGNILRLLPALGTTLFTPTSDTTAKGQPRLVCTIKSLTAYGRRTENGFVVYEGSEAVTDHRDSAGPFIGHRDDLLGKGILEAREGRLVFTCHRRCKNDPLTPIEF